MSQRDYWGGPHWTKEGKYWCISDNNSCKHYDRPNPSVLRTSGGEWLCPDCVQERVENDPEFAAVVILASQ